MRNRTAAAAPLRPVRLGPSDVEIERRPDGTLLLRSPHPLERYHDKLTVRLEHWAAVAPDRVFLAQRTRDGSWRKVAYRDAWLQVRSIAQALIERKLSVERPIAILSGNDIEHALLGLAAMMIGVPYAPISVPYSLMSSDFGKLKSIIEVLNPGLVFAADGKAFARAIDSAVPLGVEIVTTVNPLDSRPTSSFAELLMTESTVTVEAFHARVGPDTIAKILFTSGSTGYPKGVINTQRMLCSNQAMIRAGLRFVGDEPPVIVDWLPWNHTFGSNHNFNLVLDNGGSLYIDEGKPLPGAIAATAKNLKEIAPTIYFNVPKGYEALLPHLRADAELRKNFFSRLKVLFYAGAALQQYVWDALQELSVAACGERVIFISSIGSTETSPLAIACNWDYPRPGNIGVPAPGAVLKLVPNEGKLECRLKGPNITPGYWRKPELTNDAFDEEGFYKIGDALKFVDPNDPSQGLLFDGRLAEDFKLASGTWVSAGALRAQFVDHCAPLMRDAVIAGADRDDLTALVFPDIEACRKIAEVPADAPPAAVLGDAKLRGEFSRRLTALAQQSAGSSTRICRIILMAEPPSLDAGEATDKGSINQRAVLTRRKALVEELYASTPSANVISIDERN
ncbi:feruloyl-CoA synthase [Rhodoplanes sp. Z2-YC6860]|uniref:feruloyl-CoA synthase n=1 Tax=Rhodoplanes sp. Z2-YC6860 TaxID=674703 RepID=UPI00078E04A6|nr:feruloyl-CoA synthase [Rhodoplanes sp. Z2-YC6860]